MLRVTQSLRLVLSNPRGKEPGTGKREVGGELGVLELFATHRGKIELPSLSQYQNNQQWRRFAVNTENV